VEVEMMMRTSRLLVPATVLVLLLASAAPADAQTATRKFLRGLAGMTTAFLEVPGNMVEKSHERGAAQGIPLGFALGCGMIVPRVLVGVYEFVSAPFPFPEHYEPILKPEFPWGYFDGTGSPPPKKR
jgi:putative exosortase-associated protein (TIGR04073 family)